MPLEYILLSVPGAIPEAAPASVSVWSMVIHAGPMVKFIILLLLFFSVVSWAIIFFKFFQIRQARRQSYDFLELFWKSPSLSSAYAESRQFKVSPVAEIYRVGYQEVSRLWKTARENKPAEAGEIILSGHLSLENVDRALRRAGSAESMRLSRFIPFLATTGNTTPFIGLFGTVWGIMSSFHDISLSGSASLAAVAPGISEALVATAMGLAAAIPAVVAYNYFLSKVSILEAEMTNFVSDFLNILERDMLSKADKKQ